MVGVNFPIKSSLNFIAWTAIRRNRTLFQKSNAFFSLLLLLDFHVSSDSISSHCKQRKSAFFEHSTWNGPAIVSRRIRFDYCAPFAFPLFPSSPIKDNSLASVALIFSIFSSFFFFGQRNNSSLCNLSFDSATPNVNQFREWVKGQQNAHTC